jgi:Uma2 family endonuclease
MAAAAATERYTVDDLDRLPEGNTHRELVDGRVVEWDRPNHLHAALVVLLSSLLHVYVRARRLGRTVSGDPLVRVQGSPRDARGPDIAFYRRGHYPTDVRAPATATVPDFVIEILSPSDRATEVDAKVRDWLRAGVRLLWYINPDTGVTTVYHQGTIRRVEAEETLDGLDVVPGWSVRLRDLLDEFEADQREQQESPLGEDAQQ